MLIHLLEQQGADHNFAFHVHLDNLSFSTFDLKYWEHIKISSFFESRQIVLVQNLDYGKFSMSYSFLGFSDSEWACSFMVLHFVCDVLTV
jgi:hypothetical protein